VPRIEFDAVVSDFGRGGAGVALPGDAAEVFGTRARFPIRATFNGVSYRGSTKPMGDGTFAVGLTKAIRSETGADIGDAVHVVIELDTDQRKVGMPEDLVAALEAAGLTERFASMAFTHRKEYVQWILEAKKPVTRASRVETAMAMIGAGRPFS
jgi:hypothetical protein